MQDLSGLHVFGFGYNYNIGAGSAQNRIENPNMKWVKNYATNIGLDLTLWNRLALTFEWYNRETKDLLIDRAISAVPGIIDGSGIANTLMNVCLLYTSSLKFCVELESDTFNPVFIHLFTSVYMFARAL